MTPRPKDRPDEDPNVRELGGFDVTNLSVEALKRAGITFGGMVSVAVGENRAWKRHSEFLADDRPEWDVTDRAYARRETLTHVARHRAKVALLEERVGKAKAEGGKPDDEAAAALDRLRAASAEIAVSAKGRGPLLLRVREGHRVYDIAVGDDVPVTPRMRQTLRAVEGVIDVTEE